MKLIDNNGLFSCDLIRRAADAGNCVVLESTKPDAENTYGYIFVDPVDVICASTVEMTEPSLRRVDEALADGYYVAGYMAYEAGAAFEKSLPSRPGSRTPCLWFGVYGAPLVYDHRKKKFSGPKRFLAGASGEYTSPATISGVHPSIPESEYIDFVRRIKHYIREGDTYQVNFTFQLKFGFSGNPTGLYCRIRNAQRVPYSAFLGLEGSTLLSFSPELFFRIKGNAITLKPMKGTAARGRNLKEDAIQVELLDHSAKNQAENLMIVDLLRNDVGKIAQTGTVNVERFFEIEKYDTVFQATSTIRAKLQNGWRAGDTLRSLFPSGSVTGAPKIRTMQIIHELEQEPRGIYTGAIGFFSPKKEAVFNVAIRTLALDDRTKTGEMGIGSGIVHDSTPEEEYQECLLKAKFFMEPVPDFRLIETIKWDSQDGFHLLHIHLRRLKRSAAYFDFVFPNSKIRDALYRITQVLRRRGKTHRVKLLLDRRGAVEAEYSPMQPLKGIQLASLSAKRTNSLDRFLFHKTTNRNIYDDSIRKAESLGLFDFIFLNEKGEITEGARSNVIVRKGNTYYTPPDGCGLLPGVFRESFLRNRNLNVEERRLHVEDIFAADDVFLCNALRGLIKIQLVDIHQHLRKHSHAQLLAVED
ncbi:MAG: aminodeoxychorismate synthase component I [Ignavibacteriales bacterium]|nr:aminodeoxychorismate synthase component I [Ignavibacteriales bacterium]